MANEIGSMIEQFKQGIFSLRTNFGELAQLMIQEKYHLVSADDNTYDLKDPNKQGIESHVEAKCSRAYKNQSHICLGNVLSICFNSSMYIYNSNEWEDGHFFCNIEQVKPNLFRTIYYGIFWNDKIEVFCIDNEKHYLFPDSLDQFIEDKSYRKQVRENIPYFYLQHNKKDYQFHLKKKSLPVHRQNFAKDIITYEELYSLFSPKK